MAEILTEEMLAKKSPQELTTLLYEECINRLQQAIIAIDKNNFILSNQLLQNCNDIFYRLGAGLNYEAGIIADELDALYNYMAHRLITANLEKSKEPIVEVISILQEINHAWKTAQAKKVDMSSNNILKQRAAAYER